jgi:hypothetical protein
MMIYSVRLRNMVAIHAWMPNRFSGNLSFKSARVEEEHGQQGELL